MKAETKWIRYWKIVSKLHKELFRNQAEERLGIVLMASPIILFFLVWIAWYWNKASFRVEKSKRRIKQLSRVVEQSEGGVYITDKSGSIQYVNPAFEALSGYKSYEIVGKTPNIWPSVNRCRFILRFL